ncbi:hypothetical protein V5799_023707 [Amblyomma americanum]|uniref:Peptidase M13 N-terminal domain-containing protein n=1 Tax=Amblyomma americanum TaxID=6943 RepID=A0AAQ4FIU9_AMBAM
MTIVAGAAAFAIVSFIIFLAVSRLLSNTREFCLTEDCVRHTTLLTQYLDSTRDPCNNFRDYVCSAWHSSSDYSEQVTSVMDSLRFFWYKVFRDILLQGSLKIPAGRKPLAMYDMCTTGYKSGASQLTPFLEFLKRGDLTWPEPPLDLFEPLSLIVYFAYRWQSPFWISVSILEPTSSGKRRILIHYGSERKAEKYLVAYCAHRVEASYKVLVLALGFHSLFTVQDIRTIDTGFDTLVTAAIEKIDSSKWMDKESKVRATRKLTAVKKALWPPAPTLDKDELERIHAKFPEKVDTFFRY